MSKSKKPEWWPKEKPFKRLTDEQLLEKLVLAVDALRVCLNDLIKEAAVGIEVVGLESMNEDIDALLDDLQVRVDERRYGGGADVSD